MLEREAFVRKVRLYDLVEWEAAQTVIQGKMALLPDAVKRRNAEQVLALLRQKIQKMDLSDFGWPPRSSQDGNEDLLLADGQRLVSAVIRFDQRQRQAQILKYVLKEWT